MLPRRTTSTRPPTRLVATALVAAALVAVSPASPTTAAPTIAAGVATSTSQRVTGTDLLAARHRSIAQVRRNVVSRRTSAVSVVRSYLRVVERKEGTLNALISLNPDAVRQARALDRRIRAGRPVGALAGVPFVVKDNMDVAGLPTTGGSVALADNVAVRTAPVVRRLLDQDAILVGKTNMSELAASYGRLGYSSVAGLTLNPADTARNASGSSSGTAAAVASGMAVFGLGTDTSGSVRGPASVTGMVALRPTLGLFPTRGVLPLASSFDAVGAITASLQDQAAVDSVLAGSRAGTALASVPDLRNRAGLRVAVVRDFMGGDPEVDAAVDRTLARLTRRGVSVRQVDVPDEFSQLFSEVLGPVGDAEFAPELERYLAASPAAAVRTLPQLIAAYESAAAQAAPHPINPARLDGLRTAQQKRDTLSSPEIRSILTSTMPRLRAQVRSILTDHRLDALVWPTLSCVASPRWDVADDTYTCASDDPYAADYLGSATGLPEVTVPVGTDSEGLPIGVSFLGQARSEPRLLGLGALAIRRR